MDENYAELVARGSCGADLSYKIEKKGTETVLTVSGSGAMTDWFDGSETPFAPYRDVVTDIVIEDGVTSVGDFAFIKFSALTAVEIPGTVTVIGCRAFDSCIALKELILPEGTEVISPKCFEKCVSLETVVFPSTLRAIDFKAFRCCDAISSVTYRGTEMQWKHNVRISTSSLGNAPILNADISFAAVSAKYCAMMRGIADIIAAGGDGKLHIVAPDLTVPNVKEKSGDCMLFVFPNGTTMLTDCGAPSTVERIMTFIGALNIKKLDYFVLSHPHSDHLGCWEAVTRHFCENGGEGIGTYLYSGFVHKTAEAELSAYLAAHGTVMRRDVRAGDKLVIDGVDIEILNPAEEDMLAEDHSDKTVNDISVTMKLTYGKSTVLTSGDLYAQKEQQMVAKYGDKLQSDIMKCNHHGCFTSTTEEWLDTVRPKVAFSLCDDVVCTRISERFEKRGLTNYKVSECGLIAITVGANADYLVETEYEY